MSNFTASQFDLLQSAWREPLLVNQIELSLCQRESFTDGTLVGATLDRNGLRPARYVVTADAAP